MLLFPLLYGGGDKQAPPLVPRNYCKLRFDSFRSIANNIFRIFMRPLGLTLAIALAIAAPQVHAADPQTEQEKTLYALGMAISRNIVPFNLTPAELEMVKTGLSDGALGKTSKVDVGSYMEKIGELQSTRLAATAAAEKTAAQGFLAKAAAEKGATKTASGIIITTLKAGTGASPKATDQVKVHYHGTLPDGKVFDSSVQRNEPATFPLNGVIKCWTEGVQTMKVGGKSRLVCPADLAYGDRGAPPDIKPGAALIFEVELLDIVKGAAP
jgi:FKBP-type peptidyl-prolyl cis-trans isomerase FkpA